MAKGKITSKVQQGHYQTYKAESRWATNRRKKLERALKANPNNTQIATALKSLKYRRGTPKTSMWSHSNKAYAQMFKVFTGSAPHALFSTNDVMRHTALTSIKSDTSINAKFKLNPKTMYQIGQRATL